MRGTHTHTASHSAARLARDMISLKYHWCAKGNNSWVETERVRQCTSQSAPHTLLDATSDASTAFPIITLQHNTTPQHAINRTGERQLSHHFTRKPLSFNTDNATQKEKYIIDHFGYTFLVFASQGSHVGRDEVPDTVANCKCLATL